MIRRAPSQQVRHGRVYGPAVKLQYLDARGFDRLATLDISDGVELHLGSMCTLDNGSCGDGWAIGVHHEQHAGEVTGANVLGIIDTSTVNWADAADALDWLTPNTPILPTVNILVRTGTTCTWQTWLPGEPLDGPALEQKATRIVRPGDRPLHDTLTSALAADLNNGWYVRHLMASTSVLNQLAWEMGIDDHLETLALTAAREQATRLVAAGMWPVELGLPGSLGSTDLIVAWIERGNWMAPDFTLTPIYTIAGNPALAGRWDLQREYHQLRVEDTPPRVAADILLHA